MKTIVALLFAGISTVAYANQELAQKNNCLACHAVDKKIIGPAYKDVAAKYKGQADASEKLAKKIRAGGAGVWGQMPMPAHPQISEADAKKLAEWVLKQK